MIDWLDKRDITWLRGQVKLKRTENTFREGKAEERERRSIVAAFSRAVFFAVLTTGFVS